MRAGSGRQSGRRDLPSAATRLESHRSVTHRSPLILFLILLGPCFFAPSAAAQQARASRPSTGASTAPTFRISGAVVNGLTGEILRNAGVTMGKADTSETPQSVTTGDDGGFRFDGLAAGKYWLQAEARGFLQQAFEEHEGFSTGIVTGGAADTEHLMFRLRPAASIAGEIVDEANEPVREAQVMLFRRQKQDGREVTSLASGAPVNDEGHYRFKDLAPGTYFIAVEARPWYAQDLRANQRVIFAQEDAGDRVASGAGNEAQPSANDRALDVAYPVTYYPGATEESAAAPVVLKAGDHATADVRLVAVPAVHLRVHRPGVGESEPMGANLMQRMLDGPEMPVQSENMQTRKGEIELGGIAPGDYEIRVQSFGKTPETWTQRVALSTDTELSVNERATAATVKGVAKVEGGGLSVQQWFVQLRNRATGEQFTAQISEKGEFEFASQPLAPGSFEVSVGNTQDARVTRIAATGAKVIGQNVEISGAGAVQLTITLRHGLGRVDGTVLRDGRAVSGAMVVLVPQDARNNLPMLRRDQSDLDGTFSLREVLPGKYTVVAIQDGWDMDWMDVRVLNRFLKNGEVVDVRAEGKYAVKVGVQ
jgi:hypothetical protein